MFFGLLALLVSTSPAFAGTPKRAGKAQLGKASKAGKPGQANPGKLGKTRRAPARRCPELANGVRLAESGPGWRIPDTWSKRGLNWGTPELVQLTRRVARRVTKESPGATVHVADMSPRRGGPSAWHKTHRRGMDVDILFFTRSEAGEPAPPTTAMVRFDSNGRSLAKDNWGNDVAPLTFDVERNWLLVRALLQDSSNLVARILVSSPLRQELLDHATRTGESSQLIEKAKSILLQPQRALPHDDHFHVRIAARAADCRTVASSPRRGLRTAMR